MIDARALVGLFWDLKMKVEPLPEDNTQLEATIREWVRRANEGDLDALATLVFYRYGPPGELRFDDEKE